MARVVLAMSGGVDSSVAAHLLCAEGHDVIGVFMRHGQTLEMVCATDKSNALKAGNDKAPANPLAIVSPRSDHKQGCCTSSDAADARRVADRLDIPFYALDFTDAFDRIIDYFVAEYSIARTPNPCVMCNNWIKFGRLFEYADSVGADFVATGHYARLAADKSGAAEQVDGSASPQLLRGLDDDKDQSYVLFGVRRELLPRMLFPVGEFRKPQIRELAADLGFRNAEKRDSQEICFVSSGEHPEFVRRRRALNEIGIDSTVPLDTSGAIVMLDGRQVGTHDGIEGFTIGQRKGLGVALGEPHYVVKIDAETHRVTLGGKRDLERTTLAARDANWLVNAPTAPFAAAVQIRYNSTAFPAIVTPDRTTRFTVEFTDPVQGVAPGQAAVIYAGDRVLGGGWIEG